MHADAESTNKTTFRRKTKGEQKKKEIGSIFFYYLFVFFLLSRSNLVLIQKNCVRSLKCKQHHHYFNNIFLIKNTKQYHH